MERERTSKLAEYKRLADSSVGWGLLRAQNSPLVLAFLDEAFRTDTEIEMAAARAVIDSLLVTWRDVDAGQPSQTDAASYLRHWIAIGILREADYRVTMTDAAQLAKRFIEGLDRRDIGATASHLRVVQEAVRDLILRMSGSADVRREILQERKRAIDHELEELARGVIDKPAPEQERELIGEAVLLARQLTGDFRFVEDEIRQIDAELRRRMIESADEPGEVLRSLLDRTDVLASSPAGAAFQGFFQLLCDDTRSGEFRQQLRMLASGELAQKMTPDERRFFGNLMRLLTTESQAVVRRRQRTEESLRGFIESDAHRENRAIEATLSELFRIGITLRDDPAVFNPNLDVGLTLNGGPVHVQMLEHLLLMDPASDDFAGEVVVHATGSELPDDLFDRFATVPIKEIAMAMQLCLRERGPLSIAGLTTLLPIEHGLEELVARVRIAQAVNAVSLHAEEVVEFSDKDGRTIRARIPSLVMSPDAFPSHFEEMQL